MKKLLIGLAALFVLLSFAGCKPEVSTATLSDVFWTSTNPAACTTYEQVVNLPRVTSVKAGDPCWVIADIYDPDHIVDYLEMSYNSTTTPLYVSDNGIEPVYASAWARVWNADAIVTATVNFCLVDKTGKKSNGKGINITISPN